MPAQALISKARNARLQALRALNGPRRPRPGGAIAVDFLRKRRDAQTVAVATLRFNHGELPAAA